MQSVRELLEDAIEAGVLLEVMEWDTKHGPTEEQSDAFDLLFPGLIGK